ncbi:hypothetical protein NHX12_026517 [Muraenolepis orangiensis]|uniref:Uncharacterized protein n=1 Tax=Muraenolepis orangiensis TaxID=630683 RepID=A0A9Q0INB8_9TELE|nr:hypothetical protein NHX12_026517 [Muraenolepis orangiensis]
MNNGCSKKGGSEDTERGHKSEDTERGHKSEDTRAFQSRRPEAEQEGKRLSLNVCTGQQAKPVHRPAVSLQAQGFPSLTAPLDSVSAPWFHRFPSVASEPDTLSIADLLSAQLKESPAGLISRSRTH